jgi:hypothetical protein
MRDQTLTELLRQSFEARPPDGTWKLTETETTDLMECVADLLYQAYDRGRDDGYAKCLSDFRDGVETLFGVKV